MSHTKKLVINTNKTITHIILHISNANKITRVQQKISSNSRYFVNN